MSSIVSRLYPKTPPFTKWSDYYNPSNEIAFDAISNDDYLNSELGKFLKENFRKVLASGGWIHFANDFVIKCEKQYYHLYFTNRSRINHIGTFYWMSLARLNRNPKNKLEDFYTEDEAIIECIKCILVVSICCSMLDILLSNEQKQIIADFPYMALNNRTKFVLHPESYEAIHANEIKSERLKQHYLLLTNEEREEQIKIYGRRID